MEHFQSRVPDRSSRLKQKLLHVQFFKEGESPSVHEQQKFLRSFEPGVAKQSVTNGQSVISAWPNDPVRYAITALSRIYPRYLEHRQYYDMTAEELRLKDGSRMLLLRVYDKPTEPARKEGSGWFSKLFSR